MIKSLELKDFRSFENFRIDFDDKLNSIIADNGFGKTNILEAINLLCNNISSSVGLENMVKNGKDVFFIKGIFEDEQYISKEVSISYSISSKKKLINLEKKSITAKKLGILGEKTIYFSPIEMNLFYMRPSKRRDFLDNIINSSFPEYKDLLKKYENVIKNRNKILKNISEGNSSKDEINFWNQKMIELAIQIYSYREKLNNFIKDNIDNFSSFFFGKIAHIKYEYITKTDLIDIGGSIKSYLEKNLDRDIILKKTQIGPHIDDFSIIIDDKHLLDFASRGEIKSVILGLKMLELKYIEDNTSKKPILLIDDFFSELDMKHIEVLKNKISDYQSIVSAINDLDILDGKKTFLN